MTSYMLSTNYKMGGGKGIRPPFISCTSLRALISSSFTFGSKVFSLPLGNQNLPLAFAKMPSAMGQLPALCISGPAASERSGLQREYGVALGRLWPSCVHVPRGKTSVALKAGVPWCQVVLCSPCEGRTKA